MYKSQLTTCLQMQATDDPPASRQNALSSTTLNDFAALATDHIVRNSPIVVVPPAQPQQLADIDEGSDEEGHLSVAEDPPKGIQSPSTGGSDEEGQSSSATSLNEEGELSADDMSITSSSPSAPTPQSAGPDETLPAVDPRQGLETQPDGWDNSRADAPFAPMPPSVPAPLARSLPLALLPV